MADVLPGSFGNLFRVSAAQVAAHRKFFEYMNAPTAHDQGSNAVVLILNDVWLKNAIEHLGYLEANLEGGPNRPVPGTCPGC